MVDDGVRLQLLHRPVEEAEADGDAGDARIARACNVVDRVAQEDRPPAAGALDHGVDRRGMGLGDAHRVAADDAGETVRQAEIVREHVRTPVTNATLVCRLLFEKNKKNTEKKEEIEYQN